MLSQLKWVIGKTLKDIRAAAWQIFIISEDQFCINFCEKFEQKKDKW